MPGLFPGQGEDALAGGWARDRTERHREFLTAKGYEPTAYEVEQAEEAARRHQESLAQTAELNAELAEAERRLAAEDADSEDPDGPGPDGEEVDLDETS